ncbi:MAG: head decoration protein [Longimicrobiales bacterium]
MSKPTFEDQGSYTPDQLRSGEFPRVVKTVTLEGGNGVVAKGSVLGRVTASSEYKLSLAAAEDGSEAVKVILLEETDTTGGDVEAAVYLTGEFNPNDLVFGAGHTAASAEDALRALSIFLRDTGRV